MALYSDLPPVSVGGRKYVGKVVFGLLVLAAVFIGAAGGLLIVYTTDLPQVSELERYRPSSVTELYDDKGRVVGSFALQRRVIASYDDFPKVLRDAVISTEDKDFEKHWGINFWRIAGAAYKDLAAGSRAQGASTLTMQLSRNLFLSADRTYGRKAQEIMLSIQIERRFTKPQIFTLYSNQIFLGHGVYGFEAGAQYYFNKHAKDLKLEEAAVLAALPKAPNYYSPINNPERCLRRRNLVIDAMVEDGKITKDEGERAKHAPLKLNIQSGSNVLAPYFVEEIRRYLEKKYGTDEVHSGGLRVYTSLDMDLQKTANQAVLDGLATYERRHGWKGKLKNVVEQGTALDAYSNPDWDQPIDVNTYAHALVTGVSDNSATLKLGRFSASITAPDMKWTAHKSPKEILHVGDIAYVKVVSLGLDNVLKLQLEQDSGAQGALLAIENSSGDIKAMVGGRDFDESKFNRATQAMRQVGSSFKPYVYTAAMDNGSSPDDVILDAPVTFSTASGPYSPHNYDGRFEGNITLRRAIAHSRNIPALKLEQKVGVDKVIEYARKFGVTSPLPPVLPLALGAADMTLYEQTSAFSTFPNDGVRVIPRYIRKVTDYEGKVLEEDYPEVKDVIPAPTARVMVSLLEGVVQTGTGAAARSLKHPLGGKTGTTNDFTDAWFIGFSPSLTCGVWVGYDEKKTLGNKETGAQAALPIWMQFMKVAIAGHDKEDFSPPPDIPHNIFVKVDTPDSAPGEGETH